MVVAGDTNLWAGDEPLFRRLLREAALEDACRALGCGEDRRIDRVLLRSGGAVALEPLRWRVDHRLVDPRGRPLSDHLPVAVELRWRSVRH